MSSTPISHLTTGNSYNHQGAQTTAHPREEPPRDRIFDGGRKKSEFEIRQEEAYLNNEKILREIMGESPNTIVVSSQNNRCNVQSAFIHFGGQENTYMPNQTSSANKSEPTPSPIEKKPPISLFKYTKVILSAVGTIGLIYKIYQEHSENKSGAAFHAALLPPVLEGVVYGLTERKAMKEKTSSIYAEVKNKCNAIREFKINHPNIAKMILGLSIGIPLGCYSQYQVSSPTTSPDNGASIDSVKMNVTQINPMIHQSENSFFYPWKNDY